MKITVEKREKKKKKNQALPQALLFSPLQG